MRSDATHNELTYKEWMRAVDDVLLDKIGLDQDSLPDWLSRDAYENGMTVQDAATECVTEAGMGFFFDEELQDEL